MCGIIGAVASRDIVPILLEGLKRLEYRGYDSAGLAVFDASAHIERCRVLGKISSLVDAIEKNPLSGSVGIAHTRWATHGVPHEDNAHPHMSSDSIALVHNGIIENCEVLRDKLIAQGYVFSSQTDSEVIVHLLHAHFQKTADFLKALVLTVAELEGAYALAMLCADFPDQVWGVRQGSPLVVGVGKQENFLASDKLALLAVTQQFIYLEEGDVVCMTPKEVKLWDVNGMPVVRKVSESSLSAEVYGKGEYRHFMVKEIFEQATSVQHLLEQAFSGSKLRPAPFGENVQALLERAKHIVIVACGTSYHAGLVAKYWFEKIAKLPCQVDIASEFRYRNPVVLPGSLFVSISQSGETADTLAALRLAKKTGFEACLAICNVAESSLSRESDATLLTLAGPEIGVASTKAFTSQLLSLLILVLSCARHHGELIDDMVAALLHLPQWLSQVLALDEVLKEMAQKFIRQEHTLFLGRGTAYPIALEGALKLKELSYVHAEAYPAGELKHGPLALVDEHMPIILLAPKNALIDKIYSNAQEIKTRKGELFIFTDEAALFSPLGAVIDMPSVPEVIVPFVYTIPLQLFAYHVAVLKGTDVDQPRNLAKSVTVE